MISGSRTSRKSSRNFVSQESTSWADSMGRTPTDGLDSAADQRGRHRAMSKWYGSLVASTAVTDCLLLHGTAQVQKIVIARERFGRDFLPYRTRPAADR